MCFRRYSRGLAFVLLAVGAMWNGSVGAQEPRRDRDAPPRGERPGSQHGTEQAEPERHPAPPQLYRDFVFPDPRRPWGGGRYLDPSRSPGRTGASRYRYPRWYYGVGRGSRYPRYAYDDFTYRFGVSRSGDPYGDDIERAYRQGVADGQDFERFEIQAERGLEAYQHAMLIGHAAFEAGDYGLAARQFLLAATLHQGDAVSRLCAAHAEIALGRYEPAVELLRRAFGLQPKIAYLPLDIRGAYGDRGDFAEHLRALREAADDSAGAWFLVGYCLYYSDDAVRAAEAFANASRLSPGDRLFAQLAELAARSTPAPKKSPAKRKSQSTGSDL